MAHDNKYGYIEINKIPRDEPIWVSRGQDLLALEALDYYRAICIDHGCPVAHIDMIEKTQKQFQDWQEKHKAKVPD